VGSCQDCTAGGEAPAIHTFPKFPILHLRHEAARYRSWLQSVSSSISRLRFAEHGPRSLRYRTQCSLLKSGSQLLRKSERLHHPTGHASAVCITFEMTHVSWRSAGENLIFKFYLIVQSAVKTIRRQQLQLSAQKSTPNNVAASGLCVMWNTIQEFVLRD
jgi:hypothetical protein